MTTDDHPTYLDGNALTGPLSAVFTAEISTAIVTCSGCGQVAALAVSHVYGAPMGLIARCSGCGDALLRFAQSPAGTTLDLRGIRTLRLPATA